MSQIRAGLKCRAEWQAECWCPYGREWENIDSARNGHNGGLDGCVRKHNKNSFQNSDDIFCANQVECKIWRHSYLCLTLVTDCTNEELEERVLALQWVNCPFLMAIVIEYLKNVCGKPFNENVLVSTQFNGE